MIRYCLLMDQVTKPSPTTMDAVFFNREEIPVIPVYR